MGTGLELPYPNLTFVPLDVLTAEEMNEIVANYTFISQQFPLAVNNIENGTITPAKLTPNFVKITTEDPGEGTPWPDENALLIAVV